MRRRKPDFILPMQGEREVLEIYGWKIPDREGTRAKKNEREMAEGTRCDGACNDGLPCHCGPVRKQ